MQDPSSDSESFNEQRSLPSQQISESIIDEGIIDEDTTIDKRRLKTLIGLTAGQLGPRAYAAINGVLLNLLVVSKGAGALAVTFALTFGRLVNWITYPVVGRWSDSSSGRLGRRAPFMGCSLVVMGIVTILFPQASSYIELVVLIVIVRQANAVLTVSGVSIIPESVGRSRSIRTLGIIVVGAVVIAAVIKGTVLTTWVDSKPSTYALPFRIAGILMVLAGMMMLVLVREAREAEVNMTREHSVKRGKFFEDIREVINQPAAFTLLAGVMLFWSGVGATATLGPSFFEKVCHAGAQAQTVAGIFSLVVAIIPGIPVGLFISRRLSRRNVARIAPFVGGVLFGVEYFINSIWYSVLLSFIGAPFLVAYLISVGPLLMRLLPGAGGFAERFGLFLAPFSFVSVVMGYVASIAVQMTGNYRLIWVFPAGAGVLHSIVMLTLNLKESKSKVKRSLKSIKESIDLRKIRNRSNLLTGKVSSEDSDGTLIFDGIRSWVDRILEVD